jgi:hypothetical protein
MNEGSKICSLDPECFGWTRKVTIIEYLFLSVWCYQVEIQFFFKVLVLLIEKNSMLILIYEAVFGLFSISNFTLIELITI